MGEGFLGCGGVVECCCVGGEGDAVEGVFEALLGVSFSSLCHLAAFSFSITGKEKGRN